jgi:hypothetical protein
MAFDPDLYLKEQVAKGNASAAKAGFNPDVYLKTNRGGNIITSDVPTLVGEVPNPPVVQEPPRTMMDRVKAIYEVPATIATGAVAPFLGIGAGAIENIQQGTDKRLDRPELAQRFTYQPTSPVSQDILQSIGSAFEASKLPPVLPNVGMLPSYARSAGGAPTQVRQAAQTVQETGPRIAQALRQVAPSPAPVSTMSGVGAAEVPDYQVRMARALNLPVPIKLSKGEATKDFGQQAFEIETAKNFPDTVGKALIEGKADRNDAILKNFDAFVDANDKEFFSLRKVGKVVDDALTKSYDKDAGLVRAAYEKARAEGAMQDPIDYSPLTAYIQKQAPTVRAKLSPILDVVDEEIARNDLAKTGAMPINALEDIYRVINENYDFNAPKHFIEMKNIINQMTENKGGEAYTVAKKLRQKLANKYENSSYVDKLLNTKKGYSKDRIVALEDVFKHSILDGSLDDVKAIGYVLKTSGEDGTKALNELKGQTIQYIKDEVTKSTKNDVKGNPIVSPARFKAIVKELDDDEKLDYLFGKQNAQKIRDLLETTLDIHTNVDGSANYSNSSSAIIRGLDLLGKFPIPKVLGAKTAAEMVKNKELKKKVEESLNYTPEGMADALRKTK